MRPRANQDFDSIIPGHGGFTDRLDCQFIMGSYTYVHLHTFIRCAERRALWHGDR